MNAVFLQTPTVFDQASGVAEKSRSEAEALKSAAQDFEAMMIEEMLKSMRKASEELNEDGLLSSREQDFWQEWQDSQLAINMSRGQGLGLADQIIAQVEKIQDKG